MRHVPICFLDERISEPTGIVIILVTGKYHIRPLQRKTNGWTNGLGIGWRMTQCLQTRIDALNYALCGIAQRVIEIAQDNTISHDNYITQRVFD